jgi:tetratricopeptide (TPR) repeat protein
MRCGLSITPIFVLIIAVPCCRSAESAYHLLKRAEYFADLYNWRAASPLFQKAEPPLRNDGDRRNAIYAHVGVLRLASTAPLMDRSQELANLLSTDRLFLKDKQLRLFALTVKGDVDGEVDQSAARQDWTEVINLAKELGSTKWIYRAEGQLGFADYYDGDLASCQRRVASALIAATKAGDIGAQIFFLSTIAHGYEMQRLLLPLAIDYARKAIALADAYPDTGPPLIANSALIRALADMGNVSQAKQLSQKLLANTNLDYAERVDYLSSAGHVVLAEKNYREAITYFEKAISVAQGCGAFREAGDLQSTLSDIYLSLGNVAKAGELARRAVTTLERSEVIPLLPAKFDSLAQVLIAQKKYSDAHAIYQQAATLQDTLIGRADSLVVKTALITGADQLYAHHFALIADHFNNPDAAYNVVEQGRGRAIVDLLLSRGSASPQAVATERTISKLRLQMRSLHSSDEIKRLREAIFLAEQARAVNSDLTILSTNQFRPIPPRIMQQSLHSSEMLLEYVVAEPNSYALVLTQTSRQIIKLAGKKSIEKMVARVYECGTAESKYQNTSTRSVHRFVASHSPDRQ